MFLVEPTYTFQDITNPTEWRNAIGNRDVVMLYNTRGTVAPNPETTEGFGGQEIVHDTYNYEVSAEWRDYLANAEFADYIKSKRWKIGWRDEQYVHLSDGVGTAIASNPIDDKNQHYWTVTATVKQVDLIKPQEAPVGIFDEIIEPAP